MATLVLMNLVTLVLLGFGLLALANGRRIIGGPASHRDAWSITGVVYSVYACDKVIQSVWGTTAYAVGAESAIYSSYLQAAPVFNHSRTLLLFVLYAMLVMVAFQRRFGSATRILTGGLIVLALVLGGIYGLYEGEIQAARHFSATAVVDTAGFVILASVLMILLIRDAADRLLWFALCFHGFFSIVGVLFLTAGAWADTPGIWSPPFWLLELFRLFFAAGMAGFAFARYRAAIRGTPVRGLLPRNEPLGRPTLV